MTGGGVRTERTPLLRCREELFGDREGQLVRCDVGGQVGALQILFRTVRGDIALEVRPVTADPHIDRAALFVVEQTDGVDLPCVDLLEIDTDELLQTAVLRDCRMGGTGFTVGTGMVVAEVELRQPLRAVFVARCDLIEVVFEGRGEVVVDEALEVCLQQTDDRERDPRRHQGVALLDHVPAVLDGADDRRIRRRSADPEFLEHLHQRRLGEPRGRVGGVTVGRQVGGRQRLPLGELRQPVLGVVGLAAAELVDRLHVGRQEAREGDRAT